MKRKGSFPKIHSIHFGFGWILIGIVLGVVAPLTVYAFLRVICWPLCIAGGVVLCAFCIVFEIEMFQDNGKTPYYKKHLANTVSFDPEKQVPILKCSICNGEQVAGFKSKEDGSFTEVMLIASKADLDLFMKTYGLESVKKEY